jgi:alcohol dehydrogenase
MVVFAEFNFSLETRIHFGMGATNKTGGEAAAIGAHKVLVVTDSGVAEAGLLEPVLSSLQSAGITSIVFADVSSNPAAASVENAAAVARDESCDTVVAVGGGSSIDTAKGAAVVAALGGKVSDYEGWEKISGQPLPVIAIPTTAGTGSEVSYWAVISNVADHRKMLVGSPKIAPVVALVDPAMTYTLPPSLTAYTGMDALTHAVEAFTSTLSNPISDVLALAAIERIGASLRRAVETPIDEVARSNMMLASTMAAMAFNSADLGAVHCMSEALGGMYDIHHGLANAILLPHVIAFNEPAAPHKFGRIAVALGTKKGGAAEAVRRLSERLHFPSLRQVGINEVDLPRLAELSGQNISVSSNARLITKEDFLRLFKEAL